MKPLNQKAKKIFEQLIDGLCEIGDANKIDKSDGTFMAVSVDFIHENEHGKHFAVAHYYEQEGDLMADPEMVFLLSTIDSEVYPLTFRQDGFPQINQIAAIADDNEAIRMNAKLQRDITGFANMWMKNICEQQELKSKA